jgi:hypothetical protein
MKIIARIIIFALVALGVSVGLWYYLNGNLIKSKASESFARMAFSEDVKKAKGGDIVKVGLTITTGTGMSAIDLAFDTVGTNLNFALLDSIGIMPVGFDVQPLGDTVATTNTNGIKTLKRLVFISKRPEVQLPKSIFIPLYFSVVSDGKGASKSTITVNLEKSFISGPNIPGNLFTLSSEKTPLSYTVEIDDPRAASVVDLSCDDERNLSRANCGRGVVVMWKDVANEDGYKIYKNNQLIKTIGKDSTSYNDAQCENFNNNTYSVIAYNSVGSVSTTLPVVSCGCRICPTPMPPTPTPVRAENSSDLIFRVVFPDAAATVAEIPDVKVTILDDDGKRVCDGDNDCAKVITLKRVPGARIPNTFSSPQLQYPLKKNQAYSVIVKQPHTVQQTYKHVYLKWQKILQCTEGTTDSGCGELIEVVNSRTLFSGDLDGNNVIDQTDANKLTVGVGVKSAEGDLNFDGVTDQKDVEILGKNFSKKGT